MILRIILVCLLALFAQGVGATATLPTLPLSYIDTIYSAPTGATCTALNGTQFQNCLNNAALNSTIVLQAGTTYTGPFRLPNKTSGSGWIYIVSSNLASLPAVGSRVSPSDVGNMPKLLAPGGGDSAVITDRNAHHYRFVGIEFTNAAGQNVYNTVTIGNYNAGVLQYDTSTSTLPTDITFDRCYIHGDETKVIGDGKFDIRGIAMDGIRVAVINSYISNFKSPGADTQGLWAYNTPGPLKIVNNFIEGAGENVMLGGADPHIVDLVPADIEVKQNYFFKRLSWIGSGYVVKNIFELKNAKRVLAEGNIFENLWVPSGQNGYAIVFTPRNQDGTAPWTAVQDVTFRLNKVLNTHAGINLLGVDSPNPSQITQRINIHDNLFVFRSGGGRIALIIDGMRDFTINHNTAINPGTNDSSWTENAATRMEYLNNITFHGSYGFAGNVCAGNPVLCLSLYYTDYTFSKNLMIGGSIAPYPTNNYPIANDVSLVGFVNYAGGNYRLSASSPYKNAGTDGKDLGADIDAIEAAIAGVGGSAPTASFTCLPLSGIQAPGTTNCTDASTGSPESWAWTSTRCGTSTTQHPTLTCTTGGASDVCLTATNPYGSNQLCRVNYLSIRYVKPSNFGAQ